MGSIFKLIIEDDEGKTTVVPVSRGEISIGRMEGNTIRLMERNVSRRHARLMRENGAIFIEDLNSFNGVKINGERIEARLEIKEGDLVEIGDYHLALQAAEIEDESPRARTEVGGALPNAAVANAATLAEGAPSPAWSGGAGTVPDFRLPDEILAESAAALGRPGGGLDTQEPLVSPPPSRRSSGPVLPPFPSPGGGATLPMFAGAGVAAEESAGLRTEQIKVGPARTADVPRIVCVSTDYAGREFALSRPEVILGRVEDNDIVIEHRSVSRNHAKILFDGRVHKIIDLESANGILVNGEEYAITDLRKGDLIELGHVRFRFVPAGEPFLPNEEEAKAMLEAGVTPPPRVPDPVALAIASEPTPANGSAAGAHVDPQRSVETSRPHEASRSSQSDGARPAHDTTRDPVPAMREVARSVEAPRPFEAPRPQPEAPRPYEAPLRPKPAQADAMLAQSSTVEIPGMGHDPSNAMTVTDTPISALNLPDLFQPKIEPAATTVRAEPTERRNDVRPEQPGMSSLREDGPSTEVAPPPRSSVRAGGSAKAQARIAPATPTFDDDDEPEESPGRGKIAAAALIVLAIVAGLIYVIYKMVGAPDGSADRQLKALFEQSKYADVESYYLENNGRFEDHKEAFQLASEAKKRREKGPAPDAVKAVPAPPPPAAAPPPPAPAPAHAAKPDEPPPEGDAPADAPAVAEAPRPPPAPAARRPAPPPPVPAPAATTTAEPAPNKKGLQKARAYEEQGRKALLAGDLERAEKLLKACLRTYEYAACHRQLGVLYASLDDTRQAIFHYRRYIELEPGASDAAQVRAVIRKVSGGN